MKSNDDLPLWFADRFALKEAERKQIESDGDGYFFLSSEEIFAALADLGHEQCLQVHKDAALQVVLQDKFGADGRKLVADHIGIDLANEWTFTEEYLQK